MRKVEFGEIATFSQGQQVSIPDQKTEKFDGCDTFLRIVNYTQNSNDFRYIPKQSHKHHVSTDDIIMVRYGAVGFVGRGLSGVLANNMFKINFDKDQVDGNYLFRTLSSDFVQKQLLNASQSTSMAAINFKTTSKIIIPLPPLEEQKKIAAILEAADDYRQKTKALIEKYDHLTQSLFLDMFGDSTNTERTELANTVTDKGHFVDGPFGSNLKVSDQTEKGIRLIQVNNIGVRVFRDKTSRFTSVEKYETLRKHEVIPGDLVVAKMGEPLGRCCILPNHISKALVVADCMRIRVSSPHFISKYVMFFLNSYDAKQQIKNLSRGSTRVRINLSMLRKLKIPKPTLSSQNQFAERVAQIEKQKQQAEASLVKAEELFSSLLQRAFKGELTS